MRERENQKDTHGLADLNEGQDAAAQALDLQQEGVVAGRWRGGGAHLARRRAVTGNLVAVAVKTAEVLNQGIASVTRSLRALLDVVVVVAHGTRVRFASGDRDRERREHGGLDCDARLAQAGAVGALFGHQSKNTVAWVRCAKD